MSPDLQRVEIAKACGWECDDLGNWAHPSDGYERMSCDAESILPDYLNSLDAMAEAEKALTDEQWIDYCAELVNRAPTFPQYGLGSGTDKARRLASATAARKAEAFLRCLGKWTESTPDESKA